MILFGGKDNRLFIWEFCLSFWIILGLIWLNEVTTSLFILTGIICEVGWIIWDVGWTICEVGWTICEGLIKELVIGWDTVTGYTIDCIKGWETDCCVCICCWYWGLKLILWLGTGIEL
jgi:hypothetical protein